MLTGTSKENAALPSEADSPPRVEVGGLGKKFAKSLGQTLRYGIADIAGEFLLGDGGSARLRPGEFWALDDISFQVRPGEALAVIGRNGSGKSTLLKLLFGLIKPDTGDITLSGRMAALIELGAGFDPVLSGRENVYINASILGLPRAEVDEILPSIVEFSGLLDFMDTPVKFYSSGMRARLAYSIASNLSPDIFLVDEVLAVGDADFRQKCLRHMVRFVENGGSLVFVSHTANQIQLVCSHGLVLDAGRVQFKGTALEALDDYYQRSLSKRDEPQRNFEPDETTQATITAVRIEPGAGSGEIRPGGELSIVVSAEFCEEAEVVPAISILSRDLQTVVAAETAAQPLLCHPGRREFRFRMPRSPFMPGLFHVRAALREGKTSVPLAVFGVRNAPAPLLVAGDPSPEHVRARVRGQLVHIEGVWE